MNLPTAFTTFVGRRREVTEIRRRLATTRLLTVTGPGGIGKTRLALEAATAAARAFPDGVWLVDLAAQRDPEAVTSATALALTLPDVGGESVLERLTGFLAGRRALIVLDNCEHLVDACAHLAASLLSAAPGLRIVATSRQMLGVVGEHVFSLAPLPPHDAAELLRDRTSAIGRDFRISDANRASVDRLCADLDGLPLAIELAAARLLTLTVEQLAERLEDRFALLASGNRTAPTRQRTLRAAIDWSYELCSPGERLLWNRLSVFAGGFSLDAAEEVCAGDGIEPQEVLDLLDRLVVQSIVLPVEAEGLPRYRLLETIGRYGREQLAASGEQSLILRRHRAYFLTLAERTADGWYGPGQAAALVRLRVEHHNLLMALDPADDPQSALALGAALRFHWCIDGFLGEGRLHLQRALAAAPEITATRGRALWTAAWVALLQGDYAAVEQWLAEADTVGDRVGEPLLRAQVEGLRGSCAAFRGLPQEAARRFEAALTAGAAAGAGPEQVFWLFQLAVAQARLGDPHATGTGEHARATAQAHGERLTRSYSLWALGFEAWGRGDNTSSMSLIRAALEIQQDFRDHIGTIMTLGVLAWLTAGRGEYVQAARLLGAIQALTQKIGGASGVRLDDENARCEETLLSALGQAQFERALAQGRRYDSPADAAAFALGMQTVADGSDAAPVTDANILTRREREVATLVADGMSNRQIASALQCSPRTVDSHVENILAKLGFASRAQIAAWWTANQAPAA